MNDGKTIRTDIDYTLGHATLVPYNTDGGSFEVDGLCKLAAGARILETRRYKVSKLGTVTVSTKLAGKHVMVRDNGDGSYTIFPTGG